VAVRSEVSQEAWKKGGKRVSSADDGLIAMTQTAREGFRNIIRSPGVRDRANGQTDTVTEVVPLTTDHRRRAPLGVPLAEATLLLHTLQQRRRSDQGEGLLDVCLPCPDAHAHSQPKARAISHGETMFLHAHGWRCPPVGRVPTCRQQVLAWRPRRPTSSLS
jgi:hypothetical protein